MNFQSQTYSVEQGVPMPLETENECDSQRKDSENIDFKKID